MTLLAERPPAPPITRPAAIHALDNFAGTGWGVACHRLGIVEHGVELMPDAIATRAAVGAHLAYQDAWDGLINSAIVPTHSMQIASPPCQTFSVQGAGSGRAALSAVLNLIDAKAYRDPARLREWGTEPGRDERTALVLTPLAYAWQHRPEYIVWEQVPTVLPVWERCATELREWGYSVTTGCLQAEQYGVPQTRKRAILIARLNGVARMPTPTHSRYYSHDAGRLDAGVLPWVSMYDAVGWGFTNRPALTVTGHGTLPRHPTGQQQAVMASVAQGTFVFRPPFTQVTADINPAETKSLSRRFAAGSMSVSTSEAAALQSYPAAFPFQGKQGSRFLQIGNALPPLLAEAILSAVLA